MMDAVLPESSKPLEYAFFSQRFSRMVCPAMEIFRAQENSKAMASSATALEEARGVFLTSMPASSAYFTAMLSTPTPARTISFRRLPLAASICGSLIFVAERIITASNSRSAVPSSSGSQNRSTTSNPSFRSCSAAETSIPSVTNTRIALFPLSPAHPRDADSESLLHPLGDRQAGIR